MQPIKELWSAAGRCAGRGCALIRQLANIALLRSFSRSKVKVVTRPVNLWWRHIFRRFGVEVCLLSLLVASWSIAICGSLPCADCWYTMSFCDTVVF